MSEGPENAGGGAFHRPSVSGADDVGLGEVLGVLRRRSRIFVYIMLPILLLTGVALSWVTPRFSAEALIMIEADSGNRIVSLDSVVAGLSGDEESVQSEAYILSSRALAERVVQRLSLDEDPEFVASTDNGDSSGRQFDKAIDRFVVRRDIVPLENSRIIAIRFSSVDAEKSADIVNALVDEYLESRLEAKFELTQRANSWIQVQIEELRTQVAESEAEVERLRGEFGLLEGDGMTLASQELIELNTQLVMARSASAEAQARLDQVEDFSGGAYNLDTTLEVMSSPVIQKYREQEAEVERRVAELSAELGDKHPRMIQLRAEAANLGDRVEQEVKNIIAGLKNQVRIAQAREKSLETSVNRLKGNLTVSNQNAIELRAKEREAIASREMLDTLLLREKETGSQGDADFQQPDARIVSPAAAPSEASWPRKSVVLGIAFIGSLILSMFVVLTIELLDGGFRSGEQFEMGTGIPSIGFVPMIQKPSEYRTLPGYVIGRPASALGESMRTLNWSLKLAFPDNNPKIILVASSVPGEGKTTIASCLSVAVSNSDQRVLLIDADIRKPSCHDLLGMSSAPGLTNVLAGDIEVDEALQVSDFSKLTLLSAGAPSAHAPTLLGSQKMKSLLDDLSERFDLIVIDSPPIMVAADAMILSRLADATVLVLRWGSTKRQVVAHSARQLERAGAKLAGGMLSMVDVKRNSYYGYGDSSTYGKELARYYSG